nr:hypothetical protein KPHV_60700 [Kitasatospora purpeofusca]
MKPNSLHARIEQALGILFGVTANTLGAAHLASIGWTTDGDDRRTGMSFAIGRHTAYLCFWRDTPRR